MSAGDIRIRRALLSVSGDDGLADFARGLHRHGVTLLATTGTAAALRRAGLPVTDVDAVTGFPEILGGRVKTLHPRLHGGLLARRDRPEDLADLDRHGIAPIDLVAGSFYPFGDSPPAGVESIDIGGPAMLRAAAKNHAFVTAVSRPADYPAVLAEMDARGGAVPAELRARLAAGVFAMTAAYDAAVARWLARQNGESWPEQTALGLRRARVLRYGENPHQEAALYLAADAPATGGLAAARLEGGEPGYNNYADADAALALAAEFDGPAAVIVKHATPCGVAEAADPLTAWRKALAADPLSAFGGVAAFNRPVDAALAEALDDIFLEVLVAPDASRDALAHLRNRKRLRIFLTGETPVPAGGLRWRGLAGGAFLAQRADDGRTDRDSCQVVTRRAPTEAEWRDLLFAWKVAKHARSNAVVCARDGATLGVGAGHTSRVDAAEAALRKAAREEPAGERAAKQGAGQGGAAASDGFFPFADGVQRLLEGGMTAIIQPGGSLRDAESIRAADDAGAAMLFTGQRHFLH